MLKKTCCLFFALAMPALVAGAAHGDEVTLANGDRLSGILVSKEGDVLVLETKFAGALKIKWSDVSGISSDAPVWIHLQDGSRLHGKLRIDPNGALVVSAGEALPANPIGLEDILFINPSPQASGEGVRLSGRINAGLSSTSGNSRSRSSYMDAETVARARDNRYTIGGQARRVEDSDVETESRWRMYMKYDHFITKKWYAYTNGNFENDKFKDIKLRTTLGVGSGYQFLETEKTNLSLEGGLTYVNTDFELAPDEDFPAGRWALNYNHFLFGTRTQFFHFHETYVPVEDTRNTFVRSQTGFRFPLIERLNATAQYNVDWDNSPAPGRVRTDKTLLLTLGYLW